MGVVDLLEVIQVDEGHRQRPAVAGGAQELLLQHRFELAAVEHAGEGVAVGLLGQAVGARLEFVGALPGQGGILHFAQVAQGGQLLGVVDQLLHARGREQGGLEQGADVGQGFADAGQHLVELRAVQVQDGVDLLQGMFARGIGVGAEPDVGDRPGQGHAGLETVFGGRRRFAAGDAVHEVAGQVPLLGHPGAHLGVVGLQVFALQGHQGVVVAGLAQQRQVDVRLRLGQHEDAQVLQQAGQHQFFGLAQAAGLAQQAGGQRTEDAASPGALAQVLALSRRGQALGDGEAQGEADGGVEAEHGQRLAEVLDAAAAGIQGRVGDAQHARAQRHVDGDDVGGGGDVRFRVLGQFDDAQGNTGWRGQVAAERQDGSQLGRHGGAIDVLWQEYMESVTDLSVDSCLGLSIGVGIVVGDAPCPAKPPGRSRQVRGSRPW
ncbi:hypothetical protein D3C71_1146970 [compost metagenome]